MIRHVVEQMRREGGLHNIRSKTPDDFFIVCASYEPRTVTTTECLAEDYHAKTGIVYFNADSLENRAGDRIEANLEKIKSLLITHCDGIIQIAGNWADPEKQFKAIRQALGLQDDAASTVIEAITIDITTFNRESLLTTLALVRENCPDARVRSVYVSPKKHGEWLSRGFREVRSVIGFPGVQHPIYPTLLVVLSGFEPDRTFKIIEEYEPAKIFLGVGDPPINVDFLERNKREQKLIRSRQDVEEFTFPVDDIGACLNKLEKLLASYVDNQNVILAPMSTKPSTIACMLFAERHPQIQIAYCVPGEYNVDDYSSGAEDFLIDEIPRYGQPD